jgi:hypothetical protein
MLWALACSGRVGGGEFIVINCGANIIFQRWNMKNRGRLTNSRILRDCKDDQPKEAYHFEANKAGNLPSKSQQLQV